MYIATLEIIENKKSKKIFFSCVLTFSLFFNLLSYKNDYRMILGFKKNLTFGLLRWHFVSDNSGLSYLRKAAASELISEAIKRKLFIPDFSPVQSTLKQVNLSLEGTSITSKVNTFLSMKDENVSGYFIEGRTFINGKSAKGNKLYIVFKGKRTYVFDTIPLGRLVFWQTLDLDDSEFLAYIPGDFLENGNYKLGFYIEKDGVEALSYVGQVSLKLNPITSSRKSSILITSLK